MVQIVRDNKTDYLYAFSQGAGHYMSYYNSRSHIVNGVSRPPTPYYRYVGFASNINCTSTESFMTDAEHRIGYRQSRAYVKAYDEFAKECVGETSSLGIAAVESRETLDMIADKLTGLVKLARAAKRGDLKTLKSFVTPDAVRAQARSMDHWARNLTKLKVRNSKFIETRENYLNAYQNWSANSRRARLKGAGGYWLEYWLGWAPTLGDVQTSLDALATAFPYESVKTKPKAYHSSYLDQNGSEYVGGTLHKWSSTSKTSVRIQADVQVNNPNLYLRNRLGMNNFLSIAYEAVPLSFLYDWKLGLNDQIKRYTALDGVAIANPQITTKDMWNASGNIQNSLAYQEAGFPSYGPYRDRTFLFTRELPLYIETPRYFANDLKGLSITRGATAISLLLQLLK